MFFCEWWYTMQLYNYKNIYHVYQDDLKFCFRLMKQWFAFFLNLVYSKSLLPTAAQFYKNIEQTEQTEQTNQQS